MTFRHTSEKDSNLGEAFLREPTSFLLHTSHFITFSGILFPACPWKTNESLIPIPIIHVMQGYCRNLQKYRKLWKIKCNLRSCSLRFIGKGIKCMCLLKRWCDLPPPHGNVYLEGQWAKCDVSSPFAPYFGPGESLELPHGPGRESPGKPVRLTSPSLFSQGSALWQFSFGMVAYFEKNPAGGHHARTRLIRESGILCHNGHH